MNHQSSEGKRKSNMQADVKTKNGKKLKVKALVDSGVKIVDGGLYFIFSFHFILLYFTFTFTFSIFRTTRVRVYQSRCHISHKLMA